MTFVGRLTVVMVVEGALLGVACSWSKNKGVSNAIKKVVQFNGST